MSEDSDSTVPPAGHVPDAAAAMRVATAAWRRTYGDVLENTSMRLRVTLKAGIWIVKGTPIAVTMTPKVNGKPVVSERRMIQPASTGTFTAEIVRADGRVLSTARIENEDSKFASFIKSA